MTYDLGDVVSLQVTIRDSAGDPANAGAITCTITLPDLTTTAPTPANGTTGVYTVTYTPTQYGLHRVDWVATGANASAYSDVFEVRPKTPSPLLSLADARATLNLSATTDDEELRSYIEAATSMIEASIGPVSPRVVTSTITGAGTLALPVLPVISVQTIAGETNGTSYVTADVDVNGTSGVISLPSGGSFGADRYAVTYTAGRTGAIPARITQAARVLLQHLWRTQRGSSTRGRGDDDTIGTSYSMPNRVLELLASDLKLPGIA